MPVTLHLTNAATSKWNLSYDLKIATVLSNDLLTWQKLNVASFLASSVAIRFPETHRRAFVTASGTEYLPFINQPILIYQADSQDELNRALRRATERKLAVGIYTESLFATKNEEDNLREIAKYQDEEQILVGIVIYGENKLVDKAIKGLKFHP